MTMSETSMYCIGDIVIDDRPHRLRETGAEFNDGTELANGVELVDSVTVSPAIDLAKITIEHADQEIPPN